MTRQNQPPSISQRVVSAVADETDTDPIDLGPLYETIDPDCLDTLFRSDPPVSGRDPNHVRFRYGGCVVTVTSGGTIAVCPAENVPESPAAGGRAGDVSRCWEPPD